MVVIKNHHLDCILAHNDICNMKQDKQKQDLAFSNGNGWSFPSLAFLNTNAPSRIFNKDKKIDMENMISICYVFTT